MNMEEKNDLGRERENWTERERQIEHKLRMRFGFNDLIDEMIREGQERGAFDNLHGQGKPLELRSNPYEGDSQLANALLKENNLLPAWLQRRTAVQSTIDDLRQTLALRWQRHAEAYRYAQDDGRRGALALSWDETRRQLEVEIKAVNRLVDDYNLRRPSDGLELFKLTLDNELKRAGAAHRLGESA
ncbi:MAG: DnaJ family domain-containing protein [Candidatus Promineifilaceae bacterium]